MHIMLRNKRAIPPLQPTMADTPATVPSSFPKFNSLPQEIRITIWEIALPPPRIIHIESRDRKFYQCYRVRSDTAIDALNPRGIPTFFYDYEYSDERPDDSTASRFERFYNTRVDKFRFATPSPPPAILYVCHESQQVALKHHSRIFGTRYSPPGVYFDYKKDILFLDWGFPRWPGHVYRPEGFPRLELAQVRYLAIEAFLSLEHGHIFLNLLGGGNPLASQFRCQDTEDFLAMILSYFPNLEKLTVSATNHSRLDRGELCFMPLFPKQIEDADADEDGDHHEDDFETEDKELLRCFRDSFETENKLFDLEKLHCYREQRMANKENGLSPLPQIDCQIITTPATRQTLQKMRLLKATKKAD
jgi:hypothetical protein